MIKELRSKRNVKRIVLLLIIFIIPPFLFWGVKSARISGKYVVKIFGRKIPPEKFLQYRQETELNFMFLTGKSYLSKDINLNKETVKRIILIEDARRRKLSVSDKELAEFIYTRPYFQKDGKFNKQIYYRTIEEGFGTDVNSFERMLRHTLLLRKLYDQVTSGVKATSDEIKKVFLAEHQIFKADYIKIPVKPDEEKCTEKEVKKNFDENKENYRIPPKVKIKFVRIPAAEMQQYSGKIKKFKDIKQIGKFFKTSVFESNYFSLKEPIKSLGWEEIINRKAFDMEKGEVSKPILSGNNVFFIEVVDKKPSVLPPFSQVKDDVKKDCRLKKSQEQALALAQKVYTQLQKTNSQDFLAKNSLEIETTNSFKQTDYLPGIGSASYITQVLAKFDKKWSTPVPLGNNIFLFRLKEKTEPSEEDFLKEKAVLKNRILAVKENLKFMSYINSLLENPDIKISSEFLSYQY